MRSFAVVVPTLNAASDWHRFTPALLSNVRPEQVLILDSSSTDSTVDLAIAAGFHVHRIERAEFNHGGTRQLAAELMADTDILVYLTQDAILVGPDAIATLLEAFTDPDVAAAYGRQLPRQGAAAIESHARMFNYPEVSAVRSLETREQLGFKAIFISNSFAAYRSAALRGVGGFPSDTIFGEDTVVAAKLLLAHKKIAYVAGAQAYHSHSYTWRQEFRRYFDIGVLHRRESWLRDEFGNADGEGKRFVLSEIRSLWPRHAWLIPSAMVRTALKLLGYRLGRMEHRLSPRWKRRLSMHRSFWT